MGHAAVLGLIDYLVCYLIAVCPSNLPASLSEGVRPVAATSWLFTCLSSSLIPARLPSCLFLLVSLSHDAEKYDAASARILTYSRSRSFQPVATTTTRTAPLRAVNLLHPPLLPSHGLNSPLGWRVYATAAKGLACDRWDYYPVLLDRAQTERARAVSWSRCDHLVYCPDLPLTLSCNGTHVVRARDARLRAQVCPARRTRRAPHAACAEMPAHSWRVVRARLAVEGTANASPRSALRKLAGTQIRSPLAPTALHSRAPAPNHRTALAACCRHSSDDAPCARECVHCLDVRPQKRQPGERDASCCTPLPASVQPAVYATRSIIALHAPQGAHPRASLRARFTAERAANALDVRPCLRFALAGGGEDDPASATQARRCVRTVASHKLAHSQPLRAVECAPTRSTRCGCVLLRDAVIPGARRCRAISTLRSLEGTHIASAGA
ncbi:hypothetical protein FB451DRAFT_1402697 [Mycena latifolia]|nr:hypothetical protein FB451DRAFT_1402697 [Mycena latifolia]